MAWGMVDRVGGPDRLRAIVERFYRRMSEDAVVGFFFAGRNLDKIIDGQTAFLMRCFGATERYTGRPPTVAHRGLPPIRRGQFDRVDSFGIGVLRAIAIGRVGRGFGIDFALIFILAGIAFQ